MDMDEVSPKTTLDKGGPQQTNPPVNHQPFEKIQTQENTVDVSKSVEYPTIVTAPSMEKNNPDALTAKNTTLLANPLYQE